MKPENNKNSTEEISAIKKAEIEARALAEMKSNFLATMSHEIRTPMQSVYGLLELIADEKISDNARGMLATARKSASDLLEILDDILDLAKVEAGKMELDDFEIPLRTLAHGVIECLQVRLMGKSVRLNVEIANDVPFVVMGDPTRLRQVLINLVGNACKFTEKGSVTLRVHRQAKNLSSPPNGFTLRCEIEDTGIGIAPEAASRLFQPFQQADNTTTRKFGGTGLGLSICHRLITRMNGAIGAESVPGQGTTFWFEIPTRAADEQNKAPLPNLDGLAVLSVEDHPQGAKEIVSSLSSMGAKVESVSNAAEGLDLIRRRRFDVAVVDQGLPDGLGIDLLKEAARLRPFMGLILYTVRDDFGMQYTAKVIGAKYLSKPASRRGLGEAVKAAARRRAAQDYQGPRRLLIAEDTESVRDLLKRQLTKLGVTADFVGTGVAALQALEKKEHGLLFTDLHMPDMDGYQLASAIRAHEEHENVDSLQRFPVIVLTADVHMAQRQTYLSHGFDECLLKPVSLGQLKQLLIRWGVLREEEEEETTSQPSPAPSSPNVGLDRDMIVRQMGVIDLDTTKMLRAFVNMTTPHIEHLRTVANQGNRAMVAEIAHSLKGAARSACCPALGDAAARLQEVAEKEPMISPILIDRIETAFALASTEISALEAEFSND